MQGFTYTVDLTLVIDATSSMTGIIGAVKDGALRFHDDLRRAMNEKSKDIDSLRVRVIVYRDFYVDGDQSMATSEFFELPGQEDAFAKFIRGIEAMGGGDIPETGLEALAEAMRSPWTTDGTRRRQVVVVWTDASVHPLEKSADAKPRNYPANAPRDFDELTDMWEGQGFMNPNAKRLILFAPDAYAWSDISNHWENTLHFTSEAGRGLNDVDYESILDAIAQSV